MKDKKEIGLYNPLPFDFVKSHNLHDTTEEAVIKSREIAYFPPEVALHMERHLYNEIINHRKLNAINASADGTQAEILDEIRIND